jgi:hypothetical protein
VIESERPYEVARDGIDAIRTYEGMIHPTTGQQAPFVPFQNLGHFIDSFKRSKNRKLYLNLNKFDKDFPKHHDARRFDLFMKLLIASNRLAPEAILLVLDADSKDDKRAAFLKLNSVYQSEKVAIIVGVPHPETECWLLAGYVHGMSEEEERELEQYTRDTDGVDPCRQSHRLNAPNESEKRHPKCALRELCPTEARQNQCLDASFDTLRRHGQENGLAEFIDALENRLIPRLFGGTPPTR